MLSVCVGHCDLTINNLLRQLLPPHILMRVWNAALLQNVGLMTNSSWWLIDHCFQTVLFHCRTFVSDKHQQYWYIYAECTSYVRLCLRCGAFQRIALQVHLCKGHFQQSWLMPISAIRTSAKASKRFTNKTFTTFFVIRALREPQVIFISNEDYSICTNIRHHSLSLSHRQTDIIFPEKESQTSFVDYCFCIHSNFPKSSQLNAHDQSSLQSQTSLSIIDSILLRMDGAMQQSE